MQLVRSKERGGALRPLPSLLLFRKCRRQQHAERRATDCRPDEYHGLRIRSTGTQ